MTIHFRGQDVEIEVLRDHGFEPDTNSHVIDWQFIDENLNKEVLTDKEEEYIYNQLIGRNW